MSPMSHETVTSQLNDTMNEFAIPKYSRVPSLKRHNGGNSFEETVDGDENAHKRPRPTTDNFVRCAVADFGCLDDIPSNNLKEHYTSKIHQECLLKAFDLYVQQLHTEQKPDLNVSIDENDYSDLVESINILTEGVSCLHDDNVQVHNELVQIQSNVMEKEKHIGQLKLSVEENIQLIQATQLSNNILQRELQTVKNTVTDLMGQTSNDGTFIWKITGVTQKMNDAISEKHISIYSPPFYSSPTGYKMCLRLYLNGDGNSRRTHLSLFFVLMRGEYDAILEWPFSAKITFCLYDQTNNKQHLIDSFCPDSKSSSFERPRSDMNIASGIPKFCPLQIIQQDNNPYVRDDCMFIRCLVDFASTPKTMLPYICSINPGLPKTIQYAMIQEEAKRNVSTTATKDISSASSPKSENS